MQALMQKLQYYWRAATNNVQMAVNQLMSKATNRNKSFTTKVRYVGAKPVASRTNARMGNRLDMAATNSPRARAFGGKRTLGSRAFRKKLKKVALIALGVFLVVFVIGGIWAIGYVQRLAARLPSIDNPFGEKQTATEIYDRNGTSLYKVFNEFNRDPVRIEEIPHLVRWSFLAAEDVDFYTHAGFDYVAIARCGVLNVVNRTISCGGSTVTQQMLGIAVPEINEASRVEGKIMELIMATQVEQAYSKDEILQMYLTVAPFGSNIYGITSAADFYFGKDPKDLTLAEAAVLASIVQSPYYMSPTLPPDPQGQRARVERRKEYVLGQLLEKKDKINAQHRINIGNDQAEDLVSDEIIASARAQELRYRPPIVNKNAGHFVDYVIRVLQERNYKNGEAPFTISELQTGGYRIHTTLDYDLQRVSEDAIANAAATQGKQVAAANAALVTLKPNTGEVIAWVGSKSYTGEKEGCDKDGRNCTFDPQVNILTSKQSPGSSTKPHGYYEAFRQGKLFPGSFLPDIPIEYPNGYKPKNSDGRFMGITGGTVARDMLRLSRNTPAIIVLEMIGLNSYVKMMQDFGYTTFADASKFGPSVILGGSDVLPIEHAQGYAVFANGGDLVKHEVILKIEDRDGKVLYEYKNPERKRVADQRAVYLLNQTLNDNYSFSRLWDGRDAANKTGTSESNRDVWLAAYTPDVVTVAWMGNNNNKQLNRNAFGATTVLPWMRAYMKQIGTTKYFNQKTPFLRPGGITRGGGCSGTCEGEISGLKADFRLEGVDYPAEYIRRNNVKVCVDQRDHVARQIDIDLGKALKYNVWWKWLMPGTFLQGQLDNYIEKTEGRKNVIPTLPCTVDRSGGVQGPWFGTANVTGGNTVRITGFVYTSDAQITQLRAYLDPDDANNPQDGTDIRFSDNIPVQPNGSFDATFDLGAYAGQLEPGKYTISLRARDDQDRQVVAVRTGVPIFDVNGRSTNLTLTALPGLANYTWQDDIGDGKTINIRVNYNGVGGFGGLENADIFVCKNCTGNYIRGSSLAGTVNLNAGNSLAWGATQVANEDATYKFFVRARTVRNTGVIESLVPVLTIQVKKK